MAIAIIVEIAKLGAQIPGRHNQVDESIVIEIIKNASAGQALEIQSQRLCDIREARQVVVAGVGDGEERLTAPLRRHHLDLEPLPDGRGDDLAAGQVKNIIRDGLPDGVTARAARLGGACVG